MASVSIIVPAADPCPGLRRLLDALGATPLADHGVIEVIVVDNSPVPDPAITAATGDWELERSGCPLRLLHEPTGHSYSARNRGIQASQSTYLAFLDSDVIPGEGWVTSLAEVTNQGHTARATGPVEQTAEVLPLRRRDRWAQQLDLLAGLPQDRYARSGWAATANLVVRRDVFDEVGLFTATLESGGDFEFGYRANQRGFELVFEPRLAVQHRAREGLKELCAKARRVVRSDPQLRCILGRTVYRQVLPRRTRRWWPLWSWLRIGIALLIGPRRGKAPLTRRLGAAIVTPVVGVAALRELRVARRQAPEAE